MQTKYHIAQRWNGGHLFYGRGGQFVADKEQAISFVQFPKVTVHNLITHGKFENISIIANFGTEQEHAEDIN